MTKIGIVDDNRDVRQGLAIFINLSPDCRCVCTCDTAENALQVLPKHGPEVVLMGVRLPGKSGIEYMRHLKKLMPDVEVIMVTECADPGHILGALRGGASGYLLKPSSREEILAAIREVQAGGAPMSSEIARKVILHFQEQPAAEGVDRLSSREREVLERVANGSSNKEIADQLGIPVERVRCHLKSSYSKLRVRSRPDAATKLRGPK